MREHLQLTWLEWMALRLLVRSKRVGLLVLKPYGSRLAFVAKDTSDPIELMDDEPLSMQLERMYHQPSFGELDE
jgi:hypothetical protein